MRKEKVLWYKSELAGGGIRSYEEVKEELDAIINPLNTITRYVVFGTNKGTKLRISGDYHLDIVKMFIKLEQGEDDVIERTEGGQLAFDKNQKIVSLYSHTTNLTKATKETKKEIASYLEEVFEQMGFEGTKIKT